MQRLITAVARLQEKKEFSFLIVDGERWKDGQNRMPAASNCRCPDRWFESRALSGRFFP